MAIAHARAHPRRVLFIRLLLGVILLLVAVRLALPWLLTRVVNQRLAEMPGHYGVVGDIDLSLFRGAYRFNDFTIRERGDDGHPVFSVKSADLSLAWRDLVRGRVVSDVVLDAPILRLARRPGLDSDPAPPPREDWRKLVQDLAPIEITRLVIHGGSLDYADLGREPPLTVGLAKLEARFDGLANRLVPGGDEFPARGELTAEVEGGGTLQARARAAPLESPPRIEAEAQLREIHLPALNPFLHAALGIDVSAGTLDVAAEFRTADGYYEGYLKPLAHGIRYKDLPGHPRSPLKTVREAVAGAASAILKNDDTEKVGTRVPFSGNFNDTEVGRWPAFVTLLRNAFGQAIRDGVDGSVTGGGL